MKSVAIPCIPSSFYSDFCKSGSYGGVSSKYECCSTDNCNNQAYNTNNFENLPTYSSVTISVSLRVNLAFVSDYTNLNSATSLTFIQNLKTFVIIYYLLFYF